MRKFIRVAFIALLVFPLIGQLRASAQTLNCTPPPADPEIVALARALHYTIGNIYEYIYYNIDYSPSWGSKKGALGTYLDRRGNTIDQNVLFVTLLQQSCISASYRVANVAFTGDEIANLFGVQNDAAVLGNVLSAGGYPASFTGTSGQPVSTITLTTVWTEATVGSTTFDLDPSFKSHTLNTPFNLASATGYSQSSFLSAALSGSSSVSGLPSGVNSIRNVNKAQILSQLNQYSQNLESFFNGNTSTPVNQLFGGKVINNINFGAAFSSSGGTLQSTLPTSFETVYTVTVSDHSDGSNPAISQTLFASQISGKLLSLTYNASSQPVLTLESQTLATGAATGAATQTISMTVSNPYPAGDAFGTQTVRAHPKVGGRYAIVLQAGDMARDAMNRHQQRIVTASTQQASDGEILAAIGSAYVVQVSRLHELTDPFYQLATVQHELMGIAGNTGAAGTSSGITYVDFPGYFSDVAPAATGVDVSSAYGAFHLDGLMASAFESTSVAQLQGPAISTVRLFDLGNTAGIGFIEANSSNWASVQPTLANWNAGDLAIVGNFIAANSGGRVLLPQNGAIVQQNWNGPGWYQLIEGSTSFSMSFVISGGAGGGEDDVLGDLNQFAEDFELPPSQVGPLSNEPIDMHTGNYLYDHDDLSVGSGAFPFSLTLTRSYNSGFTNDLLGPLNTTGPFGKGTIHNFYATANTDSDSFEAFGDHAALNASAILVAAHVSKDITSSLTPPLANLVIGSIVASWVQDQLVQNAIVVRQGFETRKFVKIPSANGAGVYNPPPGVASTLVVNADGTKTLTDRYRNVITFTSETSGPAGQIASWSDPNGNTVSFNYNTNGMLASVGNGMGRTLTFTYDGSRRITAVSDGTRSVSYTYTAGSALASYTDAASNTTTYRYAGINPSFLMEILYPSFPSFPTVHNNYDSFGHVETQVDALGNFWTYFFANGFRSDEIDPLGNLHVIYFDPNGQVLQDINALGENHSYTYDGLGRVATHIDPRGVVQASAYPGAATETFTYDQNSNVISKTTTPEGGATDGLTNQPPVPIVEQWTYDPTFNNVLTHTDPLGNKTTYSYDTHGNLTQVVQPAVAKPGVSGTANPTTTFTYGTRGLVQTVTDPEQRVTAYSYDPTTFAPLSVTADSGRLNLKGQFAYDGIGNRISSTDPNGNTTTYAYDTMRRLTMVTPPSPFNANVTQYTYDADGRRTSVRRATGNSANPFQTTSTTYNVAGKAVAVTDPDNLTTRTGYDALIRVSTVTSPSGRQVAYAYDALSRVTQITDQVSGTLDPSITSNLGTVVREKRTYILYRDKIGTLVDGNGNTYSYLYDGFNRLASFVYPDSSSDLEFYARDANGNIALKQTRATTNFNIHYTFDALNRAISKAPDAEPTITYGYDYSGRMLQAQSSADPGPYTFGFDTAGRAVGESNPVLGTTVAWTLDANGNRTQLTWPDEFTATSVYDGLNRLTDVYEGAGTSGLRLGHYGYDALSERTSLGVGGATPVASTGYAYTPVGQISQIAHNFNGSSLSFTHNYNADRQLAAFSISDPSYTPSGLPAATHSYTANALDEYTAVDSASPTYDQNGNLTSDGTWTFAYDTESRLLSAAKSGTSASYAYDPLGRRLSKTVNGTVTRYLSLGNQEIAEYDGSGNLLRRYVFGPGVDEPLATIDGSGNHSYYFADVHGSIVALASAIGSVTEKHVYTGYGISTNATGSAFQYTGRRIDAETGLYYYRARYYSPTIGRFLQTDPIGTQGGINLYAYVGNNPLNLADPSGLSSDLSLNGGGAVANCQEPSVCAAQRNSPSGDGSGTGVLVGFVATGLAARGVLATLGIAAAGIGTAAVILTYPSSLGSNDTCDPPNCGNQFVVHGGTNTAAAFIAGNGVTVDAQGNLQGVSVQTFPNTSVQELSQRQYVPHNQIGVTTLNNLPESATVVPDPILPTADNPAGNPYHALLGGLTPDQAEAFFTPTIPNPNPKLPKVR